MLKCNVCGEEKPETEFARAARSKTGYMHKCHKCYIELLRRRNPDVTFSDNPPYWSDRDHYEQNHRAHKRYMAIHGDKRRERQRAKARENRSRLIAKYGGKCECCGEDRIEFLCIDHRNGGGGRERARYKTAVALYRELLDTPEVLPQYRVLCHNCNMSLGFYGYCPHQMNDRRAGANRLAFLL